MDLESFVAETLTQIIAGVAKAQQTLQEGGTNAQINPVFRSEESLQAGLPQPVEFDVALTAETQSEGSVGGKAGGKVGFLQVASLRSEIDSHSAEKRRNETVSRVRFTVQLSQPSHINTPKKVARPPRSGRGFVG